jgi:hypothetical protein
MFLDEIIKDKEEEKFVLEINKKIENIQDERLKIGEIIEQQLSLGIAKKKIEEQLIEITSLTKNAIKNLIEEYSFNTKYQTKYNILEIKNLKFFFKTNNILLEIDIKKILKDKNQILEIFRNTGVKENAKKNTHTFKIDDDGQELYESTKLIIEKQIGRKIKSKSELFYYMLIDFVSSNIDSLE